MCQKKIMRKRSHDHSWEEPPRKRVSPSGNTLPIKIPSGEVLTDITGKQWKIGKAIGCGGFGDIYLASDNVKGHVRNDAKYVAKIESHTNGPLFVEINCLLRIAREKMITDWKLARDIKSLGIPHYIASGSLCKDQEKLRFLILPRYEEDLEQIFTSRQCKFNIKTVIVICMQILDVLEYIHSKGYVHCDVKAANIMRSYYEDEVYVPRIEEIPHVECKQLRPKRRKNYRILNYDHIEGTFRHLRTKQKINYCENEREYSLDSDSDVETKKWIKCTVDQMCLIDYGLASKYRLSNGQHKQYCRDERKAHAGTILFCSLDAHLGAQSRRSDLESLGYNIIYWLTSSLPWINDTEHPETVQRKKQTCFQNLEGFLRTCFGEYPNFLLEYFRYVKTLTFEAKPNYKYCKKIFRNALAEYGYKVDARLDFDNLEGWGKPKKHAKLARQPLTCNIITEKSAAPVKKKVNRKKKLNWSKILLDPEEILRQSNREMFNRSQKVDDAGDNTTLDALNIWDLKPTYAMLEIFNKCRDRNGNYNGKGDGERIESRDGYTPAMCRILTKMLRPKVSEPKRPKSMKINQRTAGQNTNFKMVKRKTPRMIRRYSLRN